jgi:hypothetical protein
MVMPAFGAPGMMSREGSRAVMTRGQITVHELAEEQLAAALPTQVGGGWRVGEAGIGCWWRVVSGCAGRSFAVRQGPGRTGGMPRAWTGWKQAGLEAPALPSGTAVLALVGWLFGQPLNRP